MDHNTMIVLKKLLVVEILKGQTGLTHSFRITVPAQYVLANLDEDQFFVKMLQPPYNTKDNQDLLNQFLTNGNTIPPDDWPLFRCFIVYQSGECYYLFYTLLHNFSKFLCYFFLQI